MLEQLGRFTYRARWSVLALWLGIVVTASLFAPRVTGVLHGGGYSIGKSDSVAAYNDLNRAYGYQALTFDVVFSSGPGFGGRLMSAARRFRANAVARLGRALDISRPVWSPDHAIVFERIDSVSRTVLSVTASLRDSSAFMRTAGF